LLKNLHRLGISENLALGGGCALNSSFNGQITERTGFRHVHVPFAPGDDGNSLGAACLSFQSDCPDWRPAVALSTPYLGSPPSDDTIRTMMAFGRLKAIGRLPDVTWRAARMLADNKILGVFRGRAEFGPRALGNRSILADLRAPDIKDRINTQVKFREEFRPFAPSILDEHGPEFFEHYQTSRYMERALRFRPEVRARVPGVVHIDGTGRLQSVRREWNPNSTTSLRSSIGSRGFRWF
jgi:carbamoyltransferase